MKRLFESCAVRLAVAWAIGAIFVGIALTSVIIGIGIAVEHGQQGDTERMKACVSSGLEWRYLSESNAHECRKADDR